jgi:hypothetical protein
MRGRIIVGIGFVAAATLMWALPASAAQRPAGVHCVGDMVTVSWTPPADPTDLTGYLVQQLAFPDGQINARQYVVGLDATSVTATLFLSSNTFYVYGLDSTGQAGPLITTAGWFAGGPPAPVQFLDSPAPYNSVGDGTATVTFRLPVPPTIGVTGGEADFATISSDAGQSQTLPITSSSIGMAATATFTGLIDGHSYTFTADTANVCGDGGAAFPSRTFVPGIAPTWTANTPPLTGHPGMYRYQFNATAKPAPTYELVGAPSWLRIDSNGLVSGHPPKGITQFTYSVVAHNGVGISGSTGSDITAGPFTVPVVSS